MSYVYLFSFFLFFPLLLQHPDVSVGHVVHDPVELPEHFCGAWVLPPHLLPHVLFGGCSQVFSPLLLPIHLPPRLPSSVFPVQIRPWDPVELLPHPRECLLDSVEVRRRRQPLQLPVKDVDVLLGLLVPPVSSFKLGISIGYRVLGHHHLHTTHALLLIHL